MSKIESRKVQDAMEPDLAEYLSHRSLSPDGSGGHIFAASWAPSRRRMVLPRKIDSPGTPILRTVVLRGAPRTPSKECFRRTKKIAPQMRLGPIVIRFSTCHTYPTKNRKMAKKMPVAKVARLSFSTPPNRPSSLLKRPF